MAVRELYWREDEEDGKRVGTTYLTMRHFSHNVATGVMISVQVSQWPDSQANADANRADAAAVVERSLFCGSYWRVKNDMATQVAESLFHEERWRGTKCYGSLASRRLVMWQEILQRLVTWQEMSWLIYFGRTDDVAQNAMATLFFGDWWRGTKCRSLYSAGTDDMAWNVVATL